MSRAPTSGACDWGSVTAVERVLGSAHRVGGRTRDLQVRFIEDPDWLTSVSRNLTDAIHAGLPDVEADAEPGASTYASTEHVLRVIGASRGATFGRKSWSRRLYGVYANEIKVNELETGLAWAAAAALCVPSRARDNRPDAARHGERRSHRLVGGASPGRGQPKADGQADRADHHQDHSDGGDVDPADGRRDGELEDRPEADRE